MAGRGRGNNKIYIYYESKIQLLFLFIYLDATLPAWMRNDENVNDGGDNRNEGSEKPEPSKGAYTDSNRYFTFIYYVYLLFFPF